MCELCDETEDGGHQACQRCQRLICFDFETADDVCAPAAVTSGGDLYCASCAARIDREEEAAIDEEGY